MDNEAMDLARRAAGRLTGDFGPALPALVERQLQDPDALPQGQLQDPDAPPQRFTGVETAIAAAALLVSIAQLAWQIYRDLRKDAAEAKVTGAPPPPPPPDVVTRTLRVQVDVPAGLTTADRDRIIRVVVDETLNADPRK